ncbi:MAG: 4Fe-4S binding protein, partial [Desulfuromonadales bacterium]|nr:4Fe-4S binding protein [Desulfuromonadales bacterium]
MEAIKLNDVTANDLPWKIVYDASRCTMCGSCVATCSFRAIVPKVERRRIVFSEGNFPEPKARFSAVPVIRQTKSIRDYCRGCGMCEKVCPNDAIKPVRNPDTRLPVITRCLGGDSIKRGGRKNLEGSIRTLDKIRVGRISQMTDPSLDAQRHTFDLLAPFGRILPPHKLPFTPDDDQQLITNEITPPVNWIYPVIIGDMSIGALSWRMWEAMAMATAYLNEECGLPVRMS